VTDQKCKAFNFDPTPIEKNGPDGNVPGRGTRLNCELAAHKDGNHKSGDFEWRYDGGVPFTREGDS
jgi:hypothetical protein